jgi:hypothetical protein
VENPLARALVRGEFKPGAAVVADADAIGGVLVFNSGGATVVADAGTRRDARSRGGREPVTAGTVSEAVDQVWPDKKDTPPKRVN